jgi:DNA repair exonuclease SbcCD nuclease subunit
MKKFDIDNYIETVKNNFNANKVLTKADYSNSLVIGDMHFGTHQNSTVWLNYQVDFLEKQVLPLISISDELNIDSVVFLGDLFDSRQSINIVVAKEALNIMTKIINTAQKKAVRVYLIGGNHDYYSSFAEKKDLNIYNLLFNNDYKEKHKNLSVVTSKVGYIEKEDTRIMLLPWFETEDEERLINNLKRANTDTNCAGVYCHTDTLCRNSNENKDVFRDFTKPVWSGHIHSRHLNYTNNVFQLGAACSFNFNDANQDRFIYIINEKNNAFIEIKNEVTPGFHTIYYKSGDTDLTTLDTEEYFKFYAKPDEIKELRRGLSETGVKNASIQLMFDNISLTNNYNTDINVNIDDFIIQNIPENLRAVYNETIQKLKQIT